MVLRKTISNKKQMEEPSIKKYNIVFKLGSNFKCDFPECKKTFKHFHNLKKHKVAHTKEGLFECKICLRRFCTKQEKNRHDDTKHQKEK